MKGKKNWVMERAGTYIAKIEGHGSLEVDFARGSVRLVVHEGERLFEGILCGRTLEEMHWITPRICGVCPIAHNLASLAAAEDALGVTVTRSTRLLRRLMQVGQNVQSHILHAVFLALPDYMGMDRVTELVETDPETFALALSLKELGDEIARTVAGRNVHPTRTTVGGFHKVPSAGELSALGEMISKALPGARSLAGLFSGLDYPRLDVDIEYLVQSGAEVRSSRGRGFAVRDYKRSITEEVRGYSTAKFGSLKGGPVMVGAIARLYFKSLDGTEKEPLLAGLDFANPFHNNLAQAIEVVTELTDAVDVIGTLLSEGIDDAVAAGAKDAPLKGIGAVEAPRGGLYNEVHINADRVIRYANIITPTVQNLTSLEDTAAALVLRHRGRPRRELSRLIEMLVRAYDPCITCSTH
ncbi:MAG: Ni/Fe hydrogenase subunit alpha [Thermodesulfobacteriota bacterium]